MRASIFLWIGQILEFVTPEVIYGNFLDSFTNESKVDSSGHVSGSVYAENVNKLPYVLISSKC